MSKQTIEEYHTRLVREYPHKVIVMTDVPGHHHRTQEFQDWCKANCKGLYHFESPSSTWRDGAPGWLCPIRFASERDAALFKLLHG